MLPKAEQKLSKKPEICTVTKERTTFYLLKKGVFSQDTRNLVRILVQANVSYKNITHVIESVLATAGITAVGHISPQSVS